MIHKRYSCGFVVDQKGRRVPSITRAECWLTPAYRMELRLIEDESDDLIAVVEVRAHENAHADIEALPGVSLL